MDLPFVVRFSEEERYEIFSRALSIGTSDNAAAAAFRPSPPLASLPPFLPSCQSDSLPPPPPRQTDPRVPETKKEAPPSVRPSRSLSRSPSLSLSSPSVDISFFVRYLCPFSWPFPGNWRDWIDAAASQGTQVLAAAAAAAPPLSSLLLASFEWLVHPGQGCDVPWRTDGRPPFTFFRPSLFRTDTLNKNILSDEVKGSELGVLRRSLSLISKAPAQIYSTLMPPSAGHVPPTHLPVAHSNDNVVCLPLRSLSH